MSFDDISGVISCTPHIHDHQWVVFLPSGTSAQLTRHHFMLGTIYIYTRIVGPPKAGHDNHWKTQTLMHLKYQKVCFLKKLIFRSVFRCVWCDLYYKLMFCMLLWDSVSFSVYTIISLRIVLHISEKQDRFFVWKIMIYCLHGLVGVPLLLPLLMPLYVVLRFYIYIYMYIYKKKRKPTRAINRVHGRQLPGLRAREAWGSLGPIILIYIYIY